MTRLYAALAAISFGAAAVGAVWWLASDRGAESVRDEIEDAEDEAIRDGIEAERPGTPARAREWLCETFPALDGGLCRDGAGTDGLGSGTSNPADR